jgi:nicotinate-nucleotide--dimethylbenzimidazole phosphoribosyltransferase
MPTPEEIKAQQDAEMDSALEIPVAPAEGEPVVPESAVEPEPAVTPAAEEVVPVVPAAEPEPELEPATEPTSAETLAADNARLREELNEQARRFGQLSPASVPVSPVAPAPTPAAPAGPIEFVSAEEAESLIDKPQQVLNAVLNKVFQAGREQAMREMPTLVRQQTLSEVSLQAKVQKFWSENNDLEPYKDFCAMVANQVEVENPGLAFDAVLEKTGEVARGRLNLPKGTAEAAVVDPPPAEPSAKPALVKAPGSARRPAPVLTAVDKQAAEMEDILKY